MPGPGAPAAITAPRSIAQSYQENVPKRKFPKSKVKRLARKL